MKSSSLKILCTIALLSVVATAAPAADKTLTTGRKPDLSLRNELQHAIDRGLGWLRANENANGWWST
ncbi:MAG TPA: hypothetical protein VI454_21320, partial [Verrucomicrobiae bacterium]